ncbi:MAG: SCP2 sterol-binding domain-containing protein [Chloroflexi bacterium]|nr:SCP2 sterol-binding domain-containing protein [Chloroflexota bacterium]
MSKLRIPSMVWTILAFVPWILYWVLAGMGNTTAAILWGLGASLAINGYRFSMRQVKILDAVSLVFLAVAAFVTLVLHSDMLVFYGGVLSDATLALMAWGSLIVGNPFTYDYAKEDWDKAFWDNPIFIKTNQIITTVWGMIFTVQALVGGPAMVLGLEGTARIILVAVIPRSLLAIGIFVSVWFPGWYPQRAAARQGGGRSSGIPDNLTGLQLIEFMPLAFNAEASNGLQATIQFHLSGDGGGAGYLEIESNRCTFHPGDVDQPTLIIKSSAVVWTAISQGEMNGTEAFLNEDYCADGDLAMLMQLDKLFSA